MRRRTVVVLWLAIVLGMIVIVVLRGAVRSDMTVFLPHGSDFEERLLVQRMREGGGVLLLALDGLPLSQLAAASRALAEELRASDRVAFVVNGDGGALPGPGSRLFGYRYLLSDRIEPGYFSPERLRAAFQELVAALRRPGGMVSAELAAADPTGEFTHVLRSAIGGSARLREGVWISADGRAVLAVAPRAAPYDLDAQAALIAFIRDRAEAVAPAAELTVTGVPAIAVATRDVIREAVRQVTAIAGLGVVVLLLLVLRSLRALLAVAVPVAMAVLSGWAAVALVYGWVHAIALAFASTLLGITADYPVHLLWHARGQPTAEAARRIRRPLYTGALSTVAGLGALAFTGFPGLSQLALFAGVGITAAALVTDRVLPILVPGPLPAPARAQSMVARPALRRAGWALTLAGIAAGGWAAAGLGLDSDLRGLTPAPEALQREYAALSTAMGIPEPLYLVAVRAEDTQAALRATEAVARDLKALPPDQLAGFEAATRYLPSARTQRARRQALPTRATLTDAVAAAAEGLPLRPAAFEPFVDAVARSAKLPPLRLGDLRGGVAGARVSSLLTGLDGDRVSLLPLRGVGDPGAVARAAGAEREDVVMMDLRRAAARLVGDYQRRALLFSGLGAVVIVVLLLAATRSPRRSLRVLATVAGGVGTALAVTAVTEGALSLFHVISLLLVAGVGLDYGLFVTEPDGDCGGGASVTVCAASTVIAFGALATADVPLLHDIGVTVAVGAGACWLLARLTGGAERAAASRSAGDATPG